MKFKYITAPFVYTGLVRARILDLKFSGEKSEGKFFAMKMAQRFAESFPLAKADAVTFVPMTENAIRKRGYNQSEIMAIEVSKQLFVPFAKTLVKLYDTENQHKLSKRERMINLNGAFDVIDADKVKGKTFILCDDVKTTGTTLSRCVDTLIKAGAKDVYCLCAAITDYKTDLSF
ncbi:MAG: hypothetical protein NC185_09255 [Ruminococcus sp.]|nr:hypothetical protein [Ruminococcus sp.]